MKRQYGAMLQMVACALMWSLSGVLLKVTPWHPLVISAARSVLGIAVCLVYMHFAHIRFVRNRRAFLLGCCMAAVFMLYLPAVKLTTAANAVVLHYTAPIYVLILSALINKTRVKRGDVVAVLLTIAGMALCFMDQLGSGGILGNILALVSGMFLGIMFFLVGYVGEDERLSGLVIGLAISIVIGLPFVFTTEVPVTWEYIFYTLIHGIVQVGLSYVLYTRAIRYCSALTCSLIAVLEPLCGPIWVYFAVGEAPSAYALAGSAVVIATITVWCIWDERRKMKAGNTAGAIGTAKDAG